MLSFVEWGYRNLLNDWVTTHSGASICSSRDLAKAQVSSEPTARAQAAEEVIKGVKAFEEENDSNNLTLGPSLRDSIAKVWPENERLIDIFAVAPFCYSSQPRRLDIVLM